MKRIEFNLEKRKVIETTVPYSELPLSDFEIGRFNTRSNVKYEHIETIEEAIKLEDKCKEALAINRERIKERS